jgi:LysM repeat protein
MTAAAPARTIAITAIDPAGPTVMCRHANGVTKVTGQNGWQFTQLPRKQSMTEFMGYDGYTLVVPVMFGDGSSRTSIEPQLEVLRGIARNKVGPRNEPAVVSITCPIIPLTQLNYTINDFAFNKEYRNNDGSRYYAQIDITFFEWQPTSLVLTKTGSTATQLLAAAYSVPPAPAGSLTSSPVATPTGIINGTPVNSNAATKSFAQSSATYTVRAGDTLETIAKATLGNANSWRQIANLNVTKKGLTISDPKSIYVGQVLRLPVGAKVTVATNAPTFQQIVTGQAS